MEKFFVRAVLPTAFLLTACHDVCSVSAIFKPEAKILEASITSVLLDPALTTALCNDVTKPRDGWSVKLHKVKKHLWEPLRLFDEPPATEEIAALVNTAISLRRELNAACEEHKNGNTSETHYYLSIAKLRFDTIAKNIDALEAAALCSTRPPRTGD